MIPVSAPLAREAQAMACRSNILCAVLLIFAASTAAAQVIANSQFRTALERARAIEAGATAGDLPHHVHYDLKLYNHKGKLTTGSWDIWRDPQHSIRTDIAAGDFHYTEIEDLMRKKQWRHFNTLMPLKVYDLRQNYAEPAFIAELFAGQEPGGGVHFQQVQGAPFECTSEILQMRVCFDPLAHVFAFAQMFNQTITWEDWQAVGSHSIPKRFRIYDAGRVMVEADGQAQVVKSFPAGLFAIPADEPDMGKPEDNGSTPHKIASNKPVHLDLLYGNLLVRLEVRGEGSVEKATLIDADDDDLVKPAMEFAKHLVFAPEISNGVPTPFEQYIYLRYGAGLE